MPNGNASPGAAHSCPRCQGLSCPLQPEWSAQLRVDGQPRCYGRGGSVQLLKPILPLKGHLPLLIKHHSIPASTFLPPQSHPTPTAPIPASPKHSLSLHLCAAEPYPRCCQLFPLRSFQILLSRAVLINRNAHSRNLLDSSPPCWVYFQQTCGKLKSPMRTRPSYGETSPSSSRRILVPLHPGLAGLEETLTRISALLAFPLIPTHKEPYHDPHQALGCPNTPCPSL